MSKNNDLDMPLRDVAIQTLRQVALDTTAPAAARGAAARSIAEICGLLGKNAEGVKDVEAKSLNDLSVDELDAEIRRLTPGGSSGKKKS